MKQISPSEWFLPIFTVSEANVVEHWTKKKKRHDHQKRWIRIFFRKEKPQVSLPCKIILTRLSERKLDSDNLPVSMKWIRDAIADQIFPGMAAGMADNDPRLDWHYDQKISNEKGVLIKFSETVLT